MYVSVRILLMRDNWWNDICYKLIVYVWFTITVAYTVQGPGIARLVERLTKKPGAILTRVRVPGAARDFSPRVNFQCRLSYGVRTAPGCNHIHQHLCARQNPWTLAATLLFQHAKIRHRLVGTGSAALAAAVPYSGKATHLSREGNTAHWLI